MRSVAGRDVLVEFLAVEMGVVEAFGSALKLPVIGFLHLLDGGFRRRRGCGFCGGTGHKGT